MGQLQYEAKSTFDLDDRDLAHLRVVVMNKLRRGESFMLHLPDAGQGTRSVWLHPAIPLMFRFYGGRTPRIDVERIEQLDGTSQQPQRTVPHLTDDLTEGNQAGSGAPVEATYAPDRS